MFIKLCDTNLFTEYMPKIKTKLNKQLIKI